MNTILQLITPDEFITWTKKEIEEELPGFQFVGAGWYSKQGTWMLIINTDTPDVYALQVFYDRDPREGYRAISDAPIQSTDVNTTKKSTVSYSGLIVLIVGMMIMLPLSGFFMHKFGNAAGFILLCLFGFVWGLMSNALFPRKRVGEKKDERRTS